MRRGDEFVYRLAAFRGGYRHCGRVTGGALRVGREPALLQRFLLSLLPARPAGLAQELGSRCADRGSEPALSFHARSRKVDARAKQTGHWMGVGVAACPWVSKAAKAFLCHPV